MDIIAYIVEIQPAKKKLRVMFPCDYTRENTYQYKSNKLSQMHKMTDGKIPFVNNMLTIAYSIYTKCELNNKPISCMNIDIVGKKANITCAVKKYHFYVKNKEYLGINLTAKSILII